MNYLQNSMANAYQEIPVQICHGPLQYKIEQVCDDTQAPRALVIQGALSAISFLWQGLVDIQMPNNQVTSASIYSIIVAESGERKTTVERQFFSVIFDLIDTEETQREKAMEIYELDMEIWSRKRNDLIKKASKAPSGSQEYRKQLEEHQSNKPKKPSAGHMRILRDISQEAIADIFSHGSVISAILMSSEGEDVFLGRATQNLSIWNSLWSGDSVRIDRKGSGSTKVSGRCAMYLQAQPGIMKEFTKRKDCRARGSGFLSRTLLSVPVSTQGYREINEIRKDSIEIYDKWVADLYHQNKQAAESSEFARHVLRFSDEAKDRWFAAAQRIEQSLKPGGILYGFNDHGSKLAENIARVAGLLHCASYGLEGEISFETVSLAVDICTWFSNEYTKVFKPESEEAIDYFSMIEWLKIKRNEGDRYLRKNMIRQYAPSRIRNKEKINHILNILVNDKMIMIKRHNKSVIIDLDPYQPDNLWELERVAPMASHI